MKNNLFTEERHNDQLKFGTSVFHAFFHRWRCQLEYNPRLNEGWGKSDGEGCEHVWWGLTPLISPCQYASKQHRQDAIHLKALHQNNIGRKNAGTFEIVFQKNDAIYTDAAVFVPIKYHFRYQNSEGPRRSWSNLEWSLGTLP